MSQHYGYKVNRKLKENYINGKINQVMLYVDDQTKAVEFWVDTMGFVVISEEELAEGI